MGCEWRHVPSRRRRPQLSRFRYGDDQMHGAGLPMHGCGAGAETREPMMLAPGSRLLISEMVTRLRLMCVQL
jgi:hypothetical protein